MVVLLDTSAVVLLLRRHPPPEAAGLLDAARTAIDSGSALLPAVAASELLVGERRPAESEILGEALARIPTVILAPEAARLAGTLGAFLASRGAAIPLPDLLVAATALWLDVPLLTWDWDFARSVRVAEGRATTHPGAQVWRQLRLHAASRGD